MKEIKEHMQLNPLASRIIAFQCTPKDRTLNANAIAIDGLKFGIVSKFPIKFKSGMGYDIYILIPQGATPCMNRLHDSVLFNLKLKARAASVDELSKIKSLISSDKAVFEYINKKDSLNKITEQIEMRSRL